MHLPAGSEDGKVDAFGHNGEGVRAGRWIAGAVESVEVVPFDLDRKTLVDHEAQLDGQLHEGERLLGLHDEL